MWLKKASQCPSCRVSITPENPCREIIGKEQSNPRKTHPQSFNYPYFLPLAGGTNENYNNDDPSIKKGLRKTRGELLLQEYEVGFNVIFMLVQICNWLYV